MATTSKPNLTAAKLQPKNLNDSYKKTTEIHENKRKLVSKYNYIIVRTKSQLVWLNLPHSQILLPPVTAKRRVVKFQEISPRKGWSERL